MCREERGEALDQDLEGAGEVEEGDVLQVEGQGRWEEGRRLSLCCLLRGRSVSKVGTCQPLARTARTEEATYIKLLREVETSRSRRKGRDVLVLCELLGRLEGVPLLDARLLDGLLLMGELLLTHGGEGVRRFLCGL